MRGCLAVLVVAITTSTATATPGAIFIPPAEVDVGAGATVGPTVVGASTELRIGMHWASLYWKPTPLDLGIGYVGSYRAVAPAYAEYDEPVLRLHGGYFTLAYAIENHRHWRTWVGGRVEVMTGRFDGQAYTVFGTALRLATELYSTGAIGASDSRAVAFFAGAFAVGVYVEGTRRFGLPEELGANGIGAGVTMRIPFIAALGS